MTRVGYIYYQKQMSHLSFLGENMAYSGTVGDFFCVIRFVLLKYVL
jgi:hypothetical protein